MKKMRFYIMGLSAIIFLFNEGCRKYLDERSDKTQVVISSVADMQALLDYYNHINYYDPGAPESAADNYYVTQPTYNAWSYDQQNLYTWNTSKDFRESYGNDWSDCYDNAYTANNVLTNTNKVPKTQANRDDWDNVKGQALFLRAKCFLFAVSIWSKAYDPATSANDPGVPLPQDPDFNQKTVRATVAQSYNQIISDLREAIPLLPVTPIHVLRASRPAALALLARTYLFMREYDSCFKYANACLELKNDLLDYNSLPASASYPFRNFRFAANPEIIMQNMFGLDLLYSRSSTINIDSILYDSYAPNDLRKVVFFKANGNGTHSFKGSYFGAVNLWDGVAVDEIYLMRAECYARKGDVNNSMNDLNTLLAKRWKSGTFIPFTATDATDALHQILQERRKELVMRNIRWMDIKRLNKEGAGIILTRIINGQTYTLPPNDPRYALPLPEDIINLSGMQQNSY